MRRPLTCLLAFAALSAGAAFGGDAKTVLLSFRKNLTPDQAKAVLTEHGLDAGRWTVMCWSRSARQMVYRGVARPGLKDRVRKALDGAGVLVMEVSYLAGQVSARFEKETTRAEAAALLKRLGLDKDVRWHETSRGLRVTIRRLEHGQEWKAIDALRPQKRVRHVTLLFTVEDPL
ncbi:MAG: hypothetical protein R6V58_06875 [Planctomycetota bacterium]